VHFISLPMVVLAGREPGDPITSREDPVGRNQHPSRETGGGSGPRNPGGCGTNPWREMPTGEGLWETVRLEIPLRRSLRIHLHRKLGNFSFNLHFHWNRDGAGTLFPVEGEGQVFGVTGPEPCGAMTEDLWVARFPDKVQEGSSGDCRRILCRAQGTGGL
jgi:hypothetical protein